VRVIDENGEALGVMSSREALRRALEGEKDLVEIAPQAVPPVCRIIDYGKFVYEQQKREKVQKKAQKQMELKEIRLRAGTDTHDLEFKVRHSRGFLEEGHKVKATVMFRGREIVHQDIGRALLQKFIDALADVSKVDQAMKTEGRFLSVTLAPEVKKKAAAPKKKPENGEQRTENKERRTETAKPAASDNPPSTSEQIPATSDTQSE
jgi:translation initiation factor IF-3